MITSVLLPVLTNLPSLSDAVLLFVPVAWIQAVAALAPIIASLVGAWGANRASKNANKRTDVEKQMEQMMLQGGLSQQQFGKFLMDLSRDPIVSSRNFYQAASTGDTNTMMEMLGPEMRNISDGARQSLQTMAQLMPRTGASAEFLSSLPYQTAAQQSGLIQGARREGREGLATMGTNLASLGGNFLSGANANAGGLLDYGMDRRRHSFDVGAATGEALYNMISAIGGGIGNYYQNRQLGGGTLPQRGTPGFLQQSGYSALKPRPSWGSYASNNPSAFFGGGGG